MTSQRQNEANRIQYLDCASDYEERPIIDVTPHPKWRDQLAPYTHTLQWVDADGCSHSMTLRNDTLQGLLDDLKLIKSGIQQCKAKARQENPDMPPDTMLCDVHNAYMERRYSKRTGGHYFAHKVENGEFCYGKSQHK